MSSPQAALELAVGPLFLFICIAFMRVPDCLLRHAKLTFIHSLFGVFTSQVYYYFFSYDKDSIHLKSFVASMWCVPQRVYRYFELI